jgi:hypothetical protein
MASAVNNSAVLDFVKHTEYKAWKGIEQCANKNVTASKFFSIAVAIEKIAKALFLAAALCIEQMVLTAISLKDYFSTSDDAEKKAHLDKCKEHALGILKTGFIGIPVGFVMHLISGGKSVVNMIKDPLAEAQRNITRLDAYKEVATA